MPHLSQHPTLRTCSSDTILRTISELATANTTYTNGALTDEPCPALAQPPHLSWRGHGGHPF
ncbi:MAG: hypothetical protein IKI05_08910, partial [Bacteroidaceae bacterium]|nr:hypothetical protein [Bacteroidaceae bacterium]